MDATNENNIKKNIADLEFGVRVSLRYHAKRRGFFDLVHRTSQIVTSLTAIGAAATVFTESTALPFSLALIAAVTAAMDGAFGYTEKARIYDDLYSKFSVLAADMACQASPQEQHCREWTKRRLLIEKDEPTIIDVLNVICHNDEAQACDQDDCQYKISVPQKIFAHFWIIAPDKFERKNPPLKSDAA